MVSDRQAASYGSAHACASGGRRLNAPARGVGSVPDVGRGGDPLECLGPKPRGRDMSARRIDTRSAEVVAAVEEERNWTLEEFRSLTLLPPAVEGAPSAATFSLSSHVIAPNNSPPQEAVQTVRQTLGRHDRRIPAADHPSECRKIPAAANVQATRRAAPRITPPRWLSRFSKVAILAIAFALVHWYSDELCLDCVGALARNGGDDKEAEILGLGI